MTTTDIQLLLLTSIAGAVVSVGNAADILSAVATKSAVTPPTRVAPVFAEDFEGPRASLKLEGPRARRLKVIAGVGVGGSRGLRVNYMGGSMGSERLLRSVPLSIPGIEFTLSYDVKFDRDFQFVNGGKLHGLGPLRPITGGRKVEPEGWSARVVFRKDGRVGLYTYHQDQKGKWGESGERESSFQFEPHKYHSVSLHVRLNQPSGRANGFARLYVDGNLIESRANLRLRAVDSPDTLISQFLFSTFHGGNGPAWAPRDRNGYYTSVIADFDNFMVSPGELIRHNAGHLQRETI